jgi:hypothetical protein
VRSRLHLVTYKCGIPFLFLGLYFLVGFDHLRSVAKRAHYWWTQDRERDVGDPGRDAKSESLIMRLAVVASGDGAGQAYMRSGVSLTPLGSSLQLLLTPTLQQQQHPTKFKRTIIPRYLPFTRATHFLSSCPNFTKNGIPYRPFVGKLLVPG